MIVPFALATCAVVFAELGSAKELAIQRVHIIVVCCNALLASRLQLGSIFSCAAAKFASLTLALIAMSALVLKGALCTSTKITNGKRICNFWSEDNINK